MCYRDEDPLLLKESVDSVLSQTYKNCELILVDDASSKNYDFLNQYLTEYPQIIYQRNEVNIGLTKSLNRGLALAKGQYIARLDSDDINFPNRIELQAQFMETHPDYVLVASRFLVSENGNEFEPADSRAWESHEIKNIISSQNFAAHSTVFIRAKTLRDIGGYNEFYYYAQDYELYLRLLKIGQIKVLNEVLVKRNILEGAISQEKRRPQRFYALLTMFRGFLRYGGGISFLRNFVKSLFVVLLPATAVKTLKKAALFKV